MSSFDGQLQLLPTKQAKVLLLLVVECQAYPSLIRLVWGSN